MEKREKKEKKNVLNYLILPVGAESILNRFKLDEIWSRLEARFFFLDSCLYEFMLYNFPHSIKP